MHTDNSGWRTHHLSWVDQDWNASPPLHFDEQRRLIDKFEADSLAGEQVSRCLAGIRNLQWLMEKRAAEPMESAERGIHEAEVSALAERLVIEGTKLWQNYVIAGYVPRTKDPSYAHWFEPMVSFQAKKARACISGALRRAWNVSWRRSYFWLAAHALFPYADSKAAALHWDERVWWGVTPAIGNLA